MTTPWTTTSSDGEPFLTSILTLDKWRGRAFIDGWPTGVVGCSCGLTLTTGGSTMLLILRLVFFLTDSILLSSTVNKSLAGGCASGFRLQTERMRRVAYAAPHGSYRAFIHVFFFYGKQPILFTLMLCFDWNKFVHTDWTKNILATISALYICMYQNNVVFCTLRTFMYTPCNVKYEFIYKSFDKSIDTVLFITCFVRTSL